MTTEIPNLVEREQYAKDLTLYAEPWKKWQCQVVGTEHPDKWSDCECNQMHFSKARTYRRKPDTLTVAGQEVMKPITSAIAVFSNCSSGWQVGAELYYGKDNFAQAEQMAYALKALMEEDCEELSDQANGVNAEYAALKKRYEELEAELRWLKAIYPNHPDYKEVESE